MTVVYSFPPGTGGDHVCGMLLQKHSLHGNKVTSLSDLKNLEHQVKINKATIQDYQNRLDYLLKNNYKVIASHHTCFPLPKGLILVRAVWSDPNLTNVFINRDLLTNNWKQDVEPYINGDIANTLNDQALAKRHRLLHYIKHIKQHGLWHTNEICSEEWQAFNIDKIFTLDFVDDVMELAKKLELKVVKNDILQQHQSWLTFNSIQRFTVRKTVRHLEVSVTL